jgi:hypothetical protein
MARLRIGKNQLPVSMNAESRKHAFVICRVTETVYDLTFS